MKRTVGCRAHPARTSPLEWRAGVGRHLFVEWLSNPSAADDGMVSRRPGEYPADANLLGFLSKVSSYTWN